MLLPNVGSLTCSRLQSFWNQHLWDLTDRGPFPHSLLVWGGFSEASSYSNECVLLQRPWAATGKYSVVISSRFTVTRRAEENPKISICACVSNNREAPNTTVEDREGCTRVVPFNGHGAQLVTETRWLSHLGPWGADVSVWQPIKQPISWYTW